MSTASVELTETNAKTPEPNRVSQRDAANWFEIPSTDFNRAIRFYEQLLGIVLRREVFGDEMAIFPCWPTGVGGAIVHREWHKPASAGSLIYLNADGVLSDAVARTEALGGSVQLPVTAVPGGFGHYACIVDSEGNQIGLHSH